MEMHGSITVFTDQLLGDGSTSRVFRGEFARRSVAVKIVNSSERKAISREIGLLRRLDPHQNVIRYFTNERGPDPTTGVVNTYICLEAGVCNLVTYVGSPDLQRLISPLEVARRLTRGMQFIHSQNVAHRDVKPSNVLLVRLPNQELEVKLSDFGAAKHLATAVMSDATMNAFTTGWEVPEMAMARYNLSADVYSLGCLFYYIAKLGDVTKEHNRIVFVWTVLQFGTASGVLLRHLIESMTAAIPHRRLCMHQVNVHPYFWSDSKALNFLEAVSSRLRTRDEIGELLITALEAYKAEVFVDRWDSALEADVRVAMLRPNERVHSYNTRQLCQLLLLIRNHKAHFLEKITVAPRYESLPSGFLTYWTVKFPNLLLHVYEVIANNGFAALPVFRDFYRWW